MGIDVFKDNVPQLVQRRRIANNGVEWRNADYPSHCVCPGVRRLINSRINLDGVLRSQALDVVPHCIEAHGLLAHFSNPKLQR